MASVAFRWGHTRKVKIFRPKSSSRGRSDASVLGLRSREKDSHTLLNAVKKESEAGSPTKT
eukprot:3268825-Amphidinium_carterae.1